MSEHYSEEMKQQYIAVSVMMSRENRRVPVSGRRMTIPADGREISVVYYPAKSEHAPLILGLHGGGFLFGGNALNDPMWTAVSERLDVNIASVGYRKSPDYRFRESLEDILEALRYFRANADKFNFDPARILTMGCSAGGNLATTFCLFANQMGEPQIQGQIMIYPVVDVYTDPAEKGDGSLAQPLQYLFNDLHSTREEARLPIISPVYADPEELKSLPDAFICVAEHDSLKTEALHYAEMLKKAGVKTTFQQADDMPHGFFETGFGNVSDEELKILGPEVEEKVKNGAAGTASAWVLDQINDFLY